jgi:IS30 family transposase
MGPARKRGLSAQQRVELWRRWKEGQSLSDIARALGKPPASIFVWVTAQGGIAPPVRYRSSWVLSLRDREEISRGISRDDSIRCIAAGIYKAASTVSREIARNGGRAGYRATIADLRAWRAARRPKACKLATQHRLQRVVAEKLQLDWSPEQIAGWLREAFPDDGAMQVSHETIYRSLFVQARGVLKKELLRHLRSRRLMRRAKNATTKGQPRGQIVDAVSIRERPAEIEDRAVPGHWEGDLLTGSRNTHIATVVERQTRFTKLVKVDGKDTTSVVSALVRQIRMLPVELRRTLTWDRGTEMAGHKNFSIATDVKVYFCDPSSPWQRGTNENTNGLLRQYFPDGSDLSKFTQRHLNQIAKRLNQRPRKTLGFKSPAEKLHELVATTG